MHCKFDQLCSVICSGSIEPVSNCKNFSWCVLTMAGSDEDTPGNSNQQPLAGEEVETLLRDLVASSKRYSEELREQKRQNASLMRKMDSLQQGGLTEEGKKARIAPGKLRSCVLKRLNTQSFLVGGKFCSLRGIRPVLQHPACFYFKWRSVPWRRLLMPPEAGCLHL